MKTVLHIGAHRTGTTTFQSYLSRQKTPLLAQGVASWGPTITRKGLFSGISQPTPATRNSAMGRARGRLALRREKIKWEQGVHTLVVSEENIMGSMARNLRRARLYDDVGERVARFVAAFGDRVDHVVLSIRSLDHYWASVASHCVARGHAVPDRARLSQIAASRRSWRDVITDISCAAPDAHIEVLPFERFAGRPDALMAAILQNPAPRDTGKNWLNRRPDLPTLRRALSDRGEVAETLRGSDNRWTPFTPAEVADLRETYADDMFWLISGAGGLATVTEDLDRTEAEWPTGSLTRGQPDDKQERRMAQPR